jgi:hypothetical protein
MNAIIFPVLERFFFSRLSLKDWSVSGSNVNGRKGLCGRTERKRKKERKRERKKERRTFHEKSYIRNEKE